SAFASAPPCIGNFDGGFESGGFASYCYGYASGWTATGDAFAVVTDTNWGWGGDFNFKGNYHVRGGKFGDDKTGTLRSLSFNTGSGGYVDFLIGGGNNINNLYVALIDANTGQEMQRATGTDRETYSRELRSVP